MRHGWLAPVVLPLLLTTTQAQLRIGGAGPGLNSGNVHIHVVLSNQRSAGPFLMVRLMESSGAMSVGTTYTNDIGECDFNSIPIGSYHVEISGDGIQTTESPTFDVDNRKISQSQFVVVKKVEDSGPRPVSAHSSMVSAADLKVPSKAVKELDKANESMAMQEWKKAKEHLDKALAIDPGYVTAYNNLSVLYARMNDLPKEEEAVKKAISLDDHFAPALLNYAKLCVRQNRYVEAEALLEKEIAVEPNDPEGLLLLADSEYMIRHFEAAISYALRAHTASPEHASFVHYIAARAYQQQNQQQQALEQFQSFLKEEPKGPRADHVRGDIARIQAAYQNPAPQ